MPDSGTVGENARKATLLCTQSCYCVKYRPTSPAQQQAGRQCLDKVGKASETVLYSYQITWTRKQRTAAIVRLDDFVPVIRGGEGGLFGKKCVYDRVVPLKRLFPLFRGRT